jgi:hypothetical protein
MLSTGWGRALAGLSLITQLMSVSAGQPSAAVQVSGQASNSGQLSATRPSPSSEPSTVRFAVIGDMGDGSRAQYEVAKQMIKSRETFPFDFVLTVGDNLYGGNSVSDYARKFEIPYKPLLDAGVKFYASLGNHDNSNERFYSPFNMGGQRYYSLRKSNVTFFALDSSYMDPEQLAWLDNRLRASDSPWKICFFHHPLYSDGRRHGPDVDLRARIEPLFQKYGVDVVLSGHEHFYERIQPQHGIHYFIVGSAGQLRVRNIRPSPQTIKGFDTDRAFLLIEIAGDELRFRAISRIGQEVDYGVLTNR